MYIATINVPGYMPMDDEPPTFDAAGEAWSYLADERRRGEDDACDESCTDGPACRWSSVADYSDTVRALDAYSGTDVTGTIYGDTPGYHGDHDLGLAYSVESTE